jgi:low temperature requirement protein LtrA
VIALDEVTVELVGVIVGGLLMLFSMWWTYFDRPEEHLLDSLGAAQAWNYLHLIIFASVAAVGAGLVVGIEEATGHAHVGWTLVGFSVAVPVALYMATMFLLYIRLPVSRSHRAILPITAAIVLAAAFAPAPILVIGLVLAAYVALKVWLRVRGPATAGSG